MNTTQPPQIDDTSQIPCAAIGGGNARILSFEAQQAIVRRIVERFPRSFPHDGASIYWPYPTKSALSGDEETLRITSFLEEVVRIAQLKSSDSISLIWDDMADPSLLLSVGCLLTNIENIARTSHIYIVPADVSWAVCLRTTGDLGFGFAPVP